MLKNTLSNLKFLFQERRRAYQLVFKHNTASHNIVLKDLAKFCRAHGSCYHKDPKMSAMLEGRREVWLRIQEYLRLTEDDIYKLHHIKED